MDAAIAGNKQWVSAPLERLDQCLGICLVQNVPRILIEYFFEIEAIMEEALDLSAFAGVA